MSADHVRKVAVVLGASAGAVTALSVILPALPRDYPLPVIVVVHVPPDKKSVLAELFQAKCQVNVLEAEDKEPLVGGTVYFGPPDYHVLVESAGHLALSSEEPVRFSRPSIDVLFESAADVYGAGLVGVVLSGANDDGARGLHCIVERGGLAIVQQPETAQANEMPRAALAACPAALVLPPEGIAAHLVELGRQA